MDSQSVINVDVFRYWDQHNFCLNCFRLFYTQNNLKVCLETRLHFFFLFLWISWWIIFVWILQRVQLSWTRMETLGQRRTVSRSWPSTLTQTAAAVAVEVWETVTSTPRGAPGVRRTSTPSHDFNLHRLTVAIWCSCHTLFGNRAKR